jgi:hypothetical protein
MDEILKISPELTAMEGMLPSVMRDLERYRDNPRFLLILSCSFAELLIATLIEEHCRNGKRINGNDRDFPFSVRLTLLHEMGVLQDPHFLWLNWLRKQRNNAAHEADFRFTAKSLPAWAGKHHRTPDKLFSLCVNILGLIWNQHVELFRARLPLPVKLKQPVK